MTEQTIRTIDSISDRSTAMIEAQERWDLGNDAGEGYAWDDAPEGARQILTAETDREVDVYVLTDGSEVAVADAAGAWAVDITPATSAPAPSPYIDEYTPVADLDEHLAAAEAAKRYRAAVLDRNELDWENWDEAPKGADLVLTTTSHWPGDEGIRECSLEIYALADGSEIAICRNEERAVQITAAAIYAEQLSDSWTVVDPAGGRWWPSEDVAAEIEASDDQAATAVRICRTSPARGEWAD